MIKTAEFVSPKHPDKQCDLIADSILDAFLEQDSKTRSGIEVMGGHKSIAITGEITSKAKVDIPKLVQSLVGQEYEVNLHVDHQSLYIKKGVDTGGAGDQGIMLGYATSESENLMPREYNLARDLCRQIYAKYPYDGKVQVTVDGNSILTVVASFQNTKTTELSKFVKNLIDAKEYFINLAGEWSLGGFDADTGLSGRKIVIDSYGPEVPIGGGSFSGKDYTKVDRSGAYMARSIAVDLLKSKNAQNVLVKLAYVIGKSEPVMAEAVVDGIVEKISSKYDLTPHGINKLLKLNYPQFKNQSSWGHFGNGNLWD
jgi:S-adenosylmethionine synthetase